MTASSKAKAAMHDVILQASRAGVTRLLPRRPVQLLYKRLLDERSVPRDLVPAKLRRSGVSLLCNPYTFTHRCVLLFGEMFERATERVLHGVVREGDVFIDVGANTGHVTMLAAHLVGSSGRVLAFEPNPLLADRVRDHAAKHGVKHLELRAEGLGNVAGSFELTVNPTHLGGAAFASLRPGEMSHGSNVQKYTVPVRVGDDALAPMLASAPTAPVIIKIDVEGAELSVLAGLPHTLAQRASAVMIEVSPKWIGGEAGTRTMFEMFEKAGLLPYDFEVLEHEEHAKLPLTSAAKVQGQVNVLFAREAFLKERGLIA
jgi:FkbM family methyltransferase